MISDNTHIQSVDLKVKDLEKGLHFYSDLLGLIPVKISGREAELYSSTNKPYLIKLYEDKNALFPSSKNTGLFHTALCLPSRKELARVFLRLFENKYKFGGFSDHLVSESIYLSDPDENGIELYADRPEEEWKFENGQFVMDTLPLDLSVITKELGNNEVWTGIHPDTSIGHIHLKVSNLTFADMFYNMILGFSVTNSSYSGALFLAAGGYHHHIGANVWSTRNGTPPPGNSIGLISYTINVSEEKYLAETEKKLEAEGLIIEKNDKNSLLVKDFDNIKIRLTL